MGRLEHPTCGIVVSHHLEEETLTLINTPSVKLLHIAAGYEGYITPKGEVLRGMTWLCWEGRVRSAMGVLHDGLQSLKDSWSGSGF